MQNQDRWAEILWKEDLKSQSKKNFRTIELFKNWITHIFSNEFLFIGSVRQQE